MKYRIIESEYGWYVVEKLLDDGSWLGLISTSDLVKAKSYIEFKKQYPKGPGLALFVNWLSEEHYRIWIVAQDETGECLSWENPQIRFTKNITFQRPNISNIKQPFSIFTWCSPNPGEWNEVKDQKKIMKYLNCIKLI